MQSRFSLSLEPNVLAMEFSCTTPEEEVKRNITPEKWVCSTLRSAFKRPCSSKGLLFRGQSELLQTDLPGCNDWLDAARSPASSALFRADARSAQAARHRRRNGGTDQLILGEPHCYNHAASNKCQAARTFFTIKR